MNRNIHKENIIAMIPDSFTSQRIQIFRGNIFHKTGNSSFRLAIPLIPVGSILQYSEKLMDRSRKLLKTIYKETSPSYIMEIQDPIKINDVFLLETKMSDEMIAILNTLKELDILTDKCILSPPLKGLFLGYFQNESDFEYIKRIHKEKLSLTGNRIYKASLILFSLFLNKKYGKKFYSWKYTDIINIKGSGRVKE